MSFRQKVSIFVLWIKNLIMSRSKLRSSYMRGKHGSNKRNPHHLDEMPKNKPSKFITTRCDRVKVNWLQEPGSFGGHKTRRQGRRMVSGIVRQKIKEENRRRIERELEE